MEEKNITNENLQTSPNNQDPNTADPNFTNPAPPSDMPVNQTANQDLPPEQANQTSPLNDNKQDQTTVFGKSELLNANDILSKILNIKVGNRVADLGTGGGMFTLQAARLVGDQGEVYAVDIIKPILADVESKARMANLYNIKTVWSNIEIVGATKIPTDTLDFVLLINVLFQAKETDKMITEGARLLKTGGKMLIIDWSTTNTGLGPHNDRQVDSNNLLKQAEKINLVLEQQFKAGQYHFGMIFIKQ
ncbi:MAG: methyltransferase domain-containing protein [Candidatus Komeilibacteria bacterium]|jgi:ubiquinone/menaquinone biosynthesis C-methylase UbiE|nr:methyltransferase domain-containing protein [Candidatus Komeilibacteria bacterium]MBT4447496.1 methyltransferase domain-containing protein [Candidatus Komeilibacteria bacterium]